MIKRKHSNKFPKSLQHEYQQTVELIEDFCRLKLNDEYIELAQYTIAALARKKPSPLIGARKKSWAAGTIYALGCINNLFLDSSTIHITENEILQHFNLTKQTLRKKGRLIVSLVEMDLYDYKWHIKSQVGNNPNAWMITYNGFIVDARKLDFEMQEIAYRKGLIPYIHSEVTE